MTGNRQSLQAALDWLIVAWEATGRKGVSAGYDLVRRKWKPAYPETTGYIIPTLLDCSRLLGTSFYGDVAVNLADYELAVQAKDGAIPSLDGEPIVFDTGQVIFGQLAAWESTREAKYLDSATRASEWLVRAQSQDGSWRKYQHVDLVKVIDTRVAWAMLELDRAAASSRYEQAARANLDWAVSRQKPNGWFEDCILRPGTLPPTHTLAYTIQGLLECGILLREDKYILSAKKTADVLLGLQGPDGFLSGEFASDWKPARWSCLTGDAQMALVWFKLHSLTGDDKYRRAALVSLDFVEKRQDLHSRNPKTRGGIPGSFPIWGPYERFKYPNWATKFFIDALLVRDGCGAMAQGERSHAS